jgi:hypothetical protein
MEIWEPVIVTPEMASVSLYWMALGLAMFWVLSRLSTRLAKFIDELEYPRDTIWLVVAAVLTMALCALALFAVSWLGESARLSINALR